MKNVYFDPPQSTPPLVSFPFPFLFCSAGGGHGHAGGVDVFGTSDVVVKYVLEGHDRSVGRVGQGPPRRMGGSQVSRGLVHYHYLE